MLLKALFGVVIRCHLEMPPESVLLEPECPSHLSLPDDFIKLGAMPLFGPFLSNLKDIFFLSKLFVSFPQVMKFSLLGRNRRIFLLLQSRILCLQIRYSLVTASQPLTNPVEGRLGNIAQCKHLKGKHSVRKRNL